MLKVGVTGGIGSGKTTVCKEFEKLGIPVFYADDVAKTILDKPKVTEQLKVIFGEDIIKDNIVDRKAIASVIFSDKSKKEQLNNIIHPEVANEYTAWLNQHQNYPYTIKEAAILFETGTYKQLDKIILIIADKNTRVQRIIERDNTTEEEVLARMRNQWTDEEKIPLADFIIENNNSSNLAKQVIDIDLQIKSLS
jgi:dephospho-CoA kinase